MPGGIRPDRSTFFPNLLFLHGSDGISISSCPLRMQPGYDKHGMSLIIVIIIIVIIIIIAITIIT